MSTVTKEDIENKFKIIEKFLSPRNPELRYDSDMISCRTAFNAMGEYAKIDAIEFAKWIPQNAYIAEDEYYYCLLSDGSIATEEQLYQLYQQSKNK